MKNKLFILFLALLSLQSVYALENRPTMRRACLNRLDSLIDLQWFKPTDNCSSFTHFNVYGRDDVLAVFKILGTYTNYSLQNLSFKLANLKNWEFYLVYHKACNGTDSIYSDTIGIDNLQPPEMDMDSVSVDLVTQKTIIGWKKNPAADTKEYIVHRVLGTNVVLDVTANTFYQDPANDPQAGSISYGIAVTDSCNNSCLIGPTHSTIYLQTVYNQCDKTINLNWSSYVGWAVDNYQIFRKISSGNYQLIGTVVSNIQQFTYNFSSFGDTYCFYIRAIKQGGGSSSSSNAVCVSTNSVTASKNSYIAKASVQNSAVELTLLTETGTSLQKINIYKADGNGPFSLWQSINSTGGVLELIDAQVSVNSKTYSYYFTTEGPCQLIFDTSQTAKTILLNVLMTNPGNQDVSWSLYDDFIKGTLKQELLLSDNPNFNRSSPWNILYTLGNTEIHQNDNSKFGVDQEQICYCVRAIENLALPTYNRQDTSYSNINCVTADPIVYFPNAIQINGYNTSFMPKGVFLDYEKCSYQIYNRWGEIIYETNDIRLPWMGTSNGETVYSDVYAYKAIITGINGKVLYFDGTITVLR